MLFSRRVQSRSSKQAIALSTASIVGIQCRFRQVDKYDDPNTAVNKLMLALTGMGFDLNFPANRLKQVSLLTQ